MRVIRDEIQQASLDDGVAWKTRQIFTGTLAKREVSVNLVGVERSTIIVLTWSNYFSARDPSIRVRSGVREGERGGVDSCGRGDGAPTGGWRHGVSRSTLPSSLMSLQRS